VYKSISTLIIGVLTGGENIVQMQMNDYSQDKDILKKFGRDIT